MVGGSPIPFGYYEPAPVYVPQPRQPAFVSAPRQPEFVARPQPQQPRRPAYEPPPRAVERPQPKPELEYVRVSLPGPDELGISLRERFDFPPPEQFGIDPR